MGKVEKAVIADVKQVEAFFLERIKFEYPMFEDVKISKWDSNKGTITGVFTIAHKAERLAYYFSAEDKEPMVVFRA